MTLNPDKTAVRQRLRVLRRTLAAQSPQAALEAAARLPVPAFTAFKVVSGYRPQGAEIDPEPLMRLLAEAGATLCLPVAAHRDSGLAFRAWKPGQGLIPDAFGIPSPPPSSPDVEPDLIITPLLAFDRNGGRLGQGGGHYDRTLANLRARKRVFVLGLGYAGQEVPTIPLEPHDQRMDAILTETGYIPVV